MGQVELTFASLNVYLPSKVQSIKQANISKLKAVLIQRIHLDF